MTVSASMHDDGQNCNVKQRTELTSVKERWSEKEALSSTCLRSASVPLSFRSRYLRYAALILCVLVMSVGQVWGASVAEGTYNFVNQTIGDKLKFYKIANGIYCKQPLYKVYNTSKLRSY